MRIVSFDPVSFCNSVRVSVFRRRGIFISMLPGSFTLGGTSDIRRGEGGKGKKSRWFSLSSRPITPAEGGQNPRAQPDRKPPLSLKRKKNKEKLTGLIPPKSFCLGDVSMTLDPRQRISSPARLPRGPPRRKSQSNKVNREIKNPVAFAQWIGKCLEIRRSQLLLGKWTFKKGFHHCYLRSQRRNPFQWKMDIHSSRIFFLISPQKKKGKENGQRHSAGGRSLHSARGIDASGSLNWKGGKIRGKTAALIVVSMSMIIN